MPGCHVPVGVRVSSTSAAAAGRSSLSGSCVERVLRRPEDSQTSDPVNLSVLQVWWLTVAQRTVLGWSSG